MKNIRIPYLQSRSGGFKWWYLIAVVGILAIVGIVYWLYKTDSRLLSFIRPDREEIEEAA